MADIESRGRKYLRRFLIVCSAYGIFYFSIAFLSMCIYFYTVYRMDGLWDAIYFLPHSFPAIILLLSFISAVVLFCKRNQNAIYIFVWALLITPVFFSHDVINNLWVYSLNNNSGNREYCYLNWPGYTDRYKNRRLHGFIDKTGRYVIKPQYQSANDFCEGLACVRLNKKYGFIDKSGKYLVDPIYIDAGDFFEGFAQVRIGDKYGFINKSGTLAIDAKYDSVQDFSESVALVTDQGQQYYIDMTGQSAIISDVNSLNSFSDGLARFDNTIDIDRLINDSPVLYETNSGFIDKTGKVVIQPRYNANDFSDGYARVKDGDKYGFINKSGKYVIDPTYSYAGDFHEGLAAVKINDKYGYINVDGDFVIKPKYDRAGRFIEGLAIVHVGNNSFFINKSGETVLKPKTRTYYFSDGLALTHRGFKCGFIDKQGTMSIKPKLWYAEPFSEGLAAVTVLEKGFKTVHAYLLAGLLCLLDVIIYLLIKNKRKEVERSKESV